MTGIRLYNTRTRAKEDFTPIDADNVRMYVCGPTVYDRAHLGNARPVVVFDVLFRLLRHVYGADHVTYVRNFTDVDDKINAAALARQQAGDTRSLEALIRERTEETIGWYHADMDALGALRPTAEPRATEFIPQMVAMIEGLIAKGHAYAAEGHVLFDVRSYPAYGQLSGRSVDDMIAGARVEVAPYKRDPLDFVLWKPSSDAEPGWDSPWGRGRPGWHIECSAMADDLLMKGLPEDQKSFDIHAGGMDLQFPHHENEIAQSCCAHPEGGFAKVWLHNEMLQVEGRKMSKSLGNFFTVRDLLARYAGHPYHIPYFGPAIRLRFLQTGYRDPIDMTDVSIEQSAILLGRYYRTLEDDRSLSSAVVKEVLQRSEFIAAVSDDLNTPLAVKLLNDAAMHARIFTWPTEDGPVTYVTDAETDRDELLQKQIKAMLQFLGFELSHLRHFDYQSRSDDLKSVLNAEAAVLIEALLSDRAKARKQKDFTRADALRDGFAAAGVIVKDTPAGASWELSPEFDPAKLEALK